MTQYFPEPQSQRPLVENPENFSDPPVQMSEVTVRYSDGTSVWTPLNNASVMIGPDRVTALLMPTTTDAVVVAQAMMGMIPLASGEVRILGRNVSTMGIKRLARLHSQDVATIMPESELAPTFTVEANIQAHFRMTGRAVDPGWLTRVLEMAGIAEHRGTKYGLLDPCTQRLVDCAVALLQGPRVAIAAEPTAGLTGRSAQRVLDFLLSWVDEFGVTEIFTTGEPTIAAWADSALIIADGAVLGEQRSPTEERLHEVVAGLSAPTAVGRDSTAPAGIPRVRPQGRHAYDAREETPAPQIGQVRYLHQASSSAGPSRRSRSARTGPTRSAGSAGPVGPTRSAGPVGPMESARSAGSGPTAFTGPTGIASAFPAPAAASPPAVTTSSIPVISPIPPPSALPEEPSEWGGGASPVDLSAWGGPFSSEESTTAVPTQVGPSAPSARSASASTSPYGLTVPAGPAGPAGPPSAPSARSASASTSPYGLTVPMGPPTQVGPSAPSARSAPTGLAGTPSAWTVSASTGSTGPISPYDSVGASFAPPATVPTGPSPTWEASAPGGEPSAWAASAPAEADATREAPPGGTPPAAPSPDREPPARKGLLRLWDHAWKHRRSVEDIFDRDEAQDDEGEGDEYTY
ncbi:hypothetical protein [uncultured Actinomyces sp.]|uniref:hypothetical protein n=1 Tax=uncultured Actinomyces sp. TaxID=249061 RepID=UPI00288BE8D9|nr:hypothetical protein [uncultured Actinomyces sp.]